MTTSGGGRDLVVVGASAGGVDALRRLVAALPADLPAAVCVTIHLASGSPSMLAGILSRAASIRVVAAEDQLVLEDGVVYVSQPDAHLVVVDDHVVLGQGARENGNRPSIDALLRSAALAQGTRVVGVVLTGMLDDGTAGLATVLRYGGAALVQDPDEAEFPSMPRNALRRNPEARALPLQHLAEEVVRLVSDDGTGEEAVDVDPQQRARDVAELRSALGEDPLLPDGSQIAPPSRYGCPDCGGVLNELTEPGLRFRCRVGHAYTAASLLQHQAGTVEDALWTAMRALEEREEISSRLAVEAAEAGRDWSRVHFRRRADDARASVEVLRRVLDEQQATGAGDEDPLTAGAPWSRVPPPTTRSHVPNDDALDPDFEALLVFLRESRGVDFTGYKRTSLRRLVGRRMRAAGAADPRTYLDQLEVDTAEVRALFDSLLINVTAFFRDEAVWQSLREDVVPALLERLAPDEPVRAWSAACATGEEAYSLAMLLHEALGDEAFRRRVKIYATDVDEPALAVARAGRYKAEALAPLSDEQRDRYFTADDGEHVFRQDLRQSIIFGRHDLLADAPISRISLLLCRNALMYFTAETQSRILERFAFALHEQGVLVLGKAEMLLTHNELFGAVELSHRIFRSTRRPGAGRFTGFGPAALARQAVNRQVTEAAFLHAPDGQVVLDAEQRIALVNDRAIRELGIRREDIGRSFHEHEISYRPTDLRPVVAAVLASGEPSAVPDVRWARTGHADRWWDVQVAPLHGTDEPLGVTIVFVDVTRYHELTGELSRAHADLQEAYEELQSSSEELETTNEELQSAIEELETTNEELQSTNEELETMNEELQSTNEEMQTVNDELRERTSEVGEMNAFLESVLAGLQTAVLVVDLDLRVLVWSARCERLWGLRAFEVEGRALATLDGGLPSDRLVLSASAVLRSGQSTSPEGVVATNRLGQQMLVTTAASPLRDLSGDVRGAILTMEEHPLDDGGGP